MTLEEYAASLGYKPGGDVYTPINPYSDSGQAQNLATGTLMDMYGAATGGAGYQPAWGTAGPGGSDNVTINGQKMRRLGGDYTMPVFSQSASPPVYDPTYGWVMPFDLAQQQAAGGVGGEWGLWNMLPVLGAAVVTGGGLAGGFGGAGAAGAEAGAGAAVGAELPASYWSMQAAAAPTAAATDAAAVGAGTVASTAAPNSWLATQLTNLGLGVETANAIATTSQVGSMANTVSQLANMGGDAPYSQPASYEMPYNYDQYTGDTVGPGGTPLDSNYFTTNPALNSPGYGGMAGYDVGGGMSLADLGKFLNTPGVSSLLSGGLRAVGGVLGANRQASAVGDANNTLWNMYQQNRADLTPYRTAGYGALGNLVNMVTPGKQFDMMALDPGYQFRQEQGQNALDMKLRAGGKFYSGQSLKDTANYNQGLASQEFGNIFNRNATLAGIGQTATNAGVQSGQTTAGQVANNQVDIGNARASGYAAGLGGVANALDTYGNAQQMQQLLDLFSKRSV